MRVLDLDLDFFLHGVATWSGAGSGKRLPSNKYQPWSEAELRSFLEERCGLDPAHPLPGRAFDDHSEAFFFWRDLIRNGRLRPPFDVVHVDAHSDLGADGLAGSWHYVGTELLHLPVEQRADLPRERVTIAHFPVIAMACEWLSSFTWIYNPESTFDVLGIYDMETAGERVLQLSRFTDAALSAVFGNLSRLKRELVGPSVRFSCVEGSAYHESEPFAFVSIARSPEFTPETADALFEVITSYIRLI
jgi:hypothetical protein